MSGSRGLVAMAVVVVNGEEAGLVHRSVLDQVAEMAARLGCRAARGISRLPVSFGGADLPQLRRDLAEVAAFADATRRTGWTLGTLGAAPRERGVPLLDTPQGTVWVDPIRGFELHHEAGSQSITEISEQLGPARRTPLIDLMTPLITASSHARTLAICERRA